MDSLIFNSVLRADGSGLRGFYRIVAVPRESNSVWLAFMNRLAGQVLDEPTQHPMIEVSTETLRTLAETGDAVSIILNPIGKYLAHADDLNAAERQRWAVRTEQARLLLDADLICDTLVRHRSIAPLIQRCIDSSSASRATAYRLWRLLCVHGFDTASLYPRFALCGAPGVLRPAENGRRKNGRRAASEQLASQPAASQRGSTTDDRVKILHHARALMKPGLSLERLYPQLIERIYVNRYDDTPRGRTPIAPEQGTYPNLRQVRHIIDTGTSELERVRRKTTQGHFDRNLRGLRGRAIDGVPGPGHAYAIDSTVGDIHLRSSINRAWPVGRPIVYVVVDVWSTAIVGFYACLKGPSWDTAKLALFSTCSDPLLTASLWGYEHVEVLSPAPTLPARFWTDRGEYVSAAARETCESLGVSLAVNAAYRPDLKGLVEVLHRITKDWQSTFLPGAIDARRPELELKPSAKHSALTLREYVHYLHGVFGHYNLCADRSHRMTSEMIAAQIEPTPAGLWRFGHEAGFGYRKAMTQERLITGLLQKQTAVVRRDGVFLQSLQYESDIAVTQQWTAQARNSGAFGEPAFHFPGSVSKFWWPDPAGSLHEFRLRGNARATSDATLEEWIDALEFEKTRRAQQQHKRLAAALPLLQAQRELRDHAVEMTAEADAAYVGARLTSREARMLESTRDTSNRTAADPPSPSPQAHEADLGTEQYNALMEEVFASMQHARRD
jgi:hypothetical protein